jgi:hypothetical protein
MKKILLAFSIVALANSAFAAPPRNAVADENAAQKRCRDMVGKEATEGEGRAHIGLFQAQRFGDCMAGAPM